MAKKPAAAPKPAAPDTPPESTAPAPETTQEHAGAGETPAIVALIVTSKREGFRRAGRAWSKTQTRVDLADLTDAQVEALFAEPMLDVVGVAE